MNELNIENNVVAAVAAAANIDSYPLYEFSRWLKTEINSLIALHLLL